MAENQTNEYSKEFSDEGFWQKVKKYALVAGKEVIEKALTLYYCMQDKDTPAWAKAIILSAVGYFILPLDAIPDFVPIVGYADDLGVLVAASAMVALHIKEGHINNAKEKLKQWFRESE